MCIWCRRDARWKVPVFGKVCFMWTGGHFTKCISNCFSRNQHPGFRQMADPLPKVCVWCGRDVILKKKTSIWCRRDDTRFSKCAFGVDETLVGKCSLSKRYVLRRRDASYVILFGDELGQEWGFSISSQPASWPAASRQPASR